MIEMRRAFQIPKNDKHNFFFKKEDFGEFRTDGFFDQPNYTKKEVKEVID